MKKATNLELYNQAWNNGYYGSINHVEVSNGKLCETLLEMFPCTLHYNIVGNCIFIFKN